jgi:hypothetical protein
MWYSFTLRLIGISGNIDDRDVITGWEVDDGINNAGWG